MADNKYQEVVFVDATAKGVLALRKVLKEVKLKIKVVEKPGRSIR